MARVQEQGGAVGAREETGTNTRNGLRTRTLKLTTQFTLTTQPIYAFTE